MTKATPSYYKYWGKADKDTGEYHLLPYHCLDVAAVVAQWWDASPSIKRSFCNENRNLDETQMRAWLLFFTALHDYGKFDVRFQLRVRSTWEALYPQTGSYQNLPSMNDCSNYYHGEAGLFWFMQDHAKLLEIKPDNESGFAFLDNPAELISPKWLLWKVWLESVMGHHGHIKLTEFVTDKNLPFMYDRRLAEIDQETRKSWLDELERIFLGPVRLSRNDLPPVYVPLMAGFCSVSDWLGSRCDDRHFTYRQTPIDLKAYFDDRCENDAKSIVAFAGVISSPKAYSGIESILKPGNTKRSIQTLIDQLPLQEGLTIVEAPTGSGKTEAAFAYAWRLISAGLADSIVFALPTQATANAMLNRITPIATKLFGDHPNLLLAHGSARFNEAFATLKRKALTGFENEDGWTQCAQWLAESRKRVFLGQIGICTVDQVLISVLPVRHRFVRAFGLGRSVLIVDEVHAYDAYMYGLLEEVLDQQKQSGGSAILLSATLPERQRSQLCKAWTVDLAAQNENAGAAYPLITCTNGHTTSFLTVDASQQLGGVTVNIEPLPTLEMKPDDSLFRRIITAAEMGAQVAIVCNMVDVAQNITRGLRLQTDIPVDLFHARYCYTHRQDKELHAIHHFGPNDNRTTGRILVATQVVEQSLDLDFDWLITQLCPVDLLFQRIGRLHRHNRLYRPTGFESPVCTILLPENDGFGLHGKIYANTRLLWRTEKMLSNAPNGRIIFPDAYRTWIEACYKEEPWDNEPEHVTKTYEEFKSTVEEVKQFKARYMIQTAMNPFADTDEHVTAITRDGDMNLTVVPFCKTEQGTMLMDGTILERHDENKRLECLSLNAVGVPKSWQYWLNELEDGRYWLQMETAGEGYRGLSKRELFTYHKDFGLERIR